MPPGFSTASFEAHRSGVSWLWSLPFARNLLSMAHSRLPILSWLNKSSFFHDASQQTEPLSPLTTLGANKILFHIIDHYLRNSALLRTGYAIIHTVRARLLHPFFFRKLFEDTLHNLSVPRYVICSSSGNDWKFLNIEWRFMLMLITLTTLYAVWCLAFFLSKVRSLYVVLTRIFIYVCVDVNSYIFPSHTIIQS